MNIEIKKVIEEIMNENDNLVGKTISDVRIACRIRMQRKGIDDAIVNQLNFEANRLIEEIELYYEVDQKHLGCPALWAGAKLIRKKEGK